jgi:hypothetical protein
MDNDNITDISIARKTDNEYARETVADIRDRVFHADLADIIGFMVMWWDAEGGLHYEWSENIDTNEALLALAQIQHIEVSATMEIYEDE